MSLGIKLSDLVTARGGSDRFGIVVADSFCKMDKCVVRDCKYDGIECIDEGACKAVDTRIVSCRKGVLVSAGRWVDFERCEITFANVPIFMRHWASGEFKEKNIVAESELDVSCTRHFLLSGQVNDNPVMYVYSYIYV